MIKSYDFNNEAIKLLKEAINLSARGEMIHDTLSRSAHMKGLQGFKRWHKVQSKEDRCHRVDLQHYVIDMFSENLEPSWEELEGVKEPLTIKEHLELYLDWEIEVYTTIASISNRLVAKFPKEAEKVLNPLCGVSKEIEKIRRWLQDFEFTGYDASYIKLFDKMLHDKVKEIEEKE